MSSENEVKHERRQEKRNRYLCARIKNNDLNAPSYIVKENEKLIRSVIKDVDKGAVSAVLNISNIDHDDLMQVGSISLINAAIRYDEERDINFSTYAHKVIRNALIDYIRNNAAGYELKMINKGLSRVFLNDDPVDDAGVPIIEKYGKGGKDPTGNLAVLRVMIEKMKNRLLRLSPRKYRLITYLYGLETKDERTDTETAEHFHLAERYLRSLKRKTLKELQDGMNDGQIILSRT